MPLTSTELGTFATTGLLIKDGFVPTPLVERAQQLIQDWYRNELDQQHLTTYTQRTFAPDLGSHPDLLALFSDSGADRLVEELLGQFTPVDTVQVQIRVPEADLEHPQPEKAMHVDGVSCPHLDPDELRTFSLLAGVVLSPISDPAGGALRYLPGGHLRMAEWFTTEWKLGITDQVPPQLAAEQGTPFLGAPGDLILMHHLLPHAVGRNDTPIPRVMAYFRVSHIHHTERRLDALRDPWLDYPALAAARTR